MKHTFLSIQSNQSSAAARELPHDTTTTPGSILEHIGRALAAKFWKYTETGEKSDYSSFKGIL
jgi:hypothetical protein